MTKVTQMTSPPVDGIGQGGVFTIGYSHLELEAFLALLHCNRIDAVVDVRMTPTSRRRGFSKSALATALAADGIGYLHEPALGNPKDNRAAFSSKSPERGCARMRAILDTVPALLEDLAARAGRERISIMCVEKSDALCHRQVIVERLLEIAPSLTSRSLG